MISDMKLFELLRRIQKITILQLDNHALINFISYHDEDYEVYFICGTNDGESIYRTTLN